MSSRFLLALAVVTMAATPVAGQMGTHMAMHQTLQPILPAVAADPALVELGKQLFFDPRLSKSGVISCNTCHNLSLGGSDNLRTSIGHGWQKGPINSPTVLNARFNLAQFWDGRATDLQAQAGGPIANPGEMAFTHELAVEVVRSIPGYVTTFRQVFGTPDVSIDRITKAIAAFEDTLVTPNSRFDRWLTGQSAALSDDEVAGLALFRESGCTNCHNGPALGGTSFRRLGIAEPYATESKVEGRVAVTGNERDRLAFKVPTLRNIELTYPYFHDGAIDTLSEAVETMGRVQLGRRIGAEDNVRIVAFLRTLTGDQPSFALPILPPSSDKTPRPLP